MICLNLKMKIKEVVVEVFTCPSASFYNFSLSQIMPTKCMPLDVICYYLVVYALGLLMRMHQQKQ